MRDLGSRSKSEAEVGECILSVPKVANHFIPPLEVCRYVCAAVSSLVNSQYSNLHLFIPNRCAQELIFDLKGFLSVELSEVNAAGRISPVAAFGIINTHSIYLELESQLYPKSVRDILL